DWSLSRRGPPEYDFAMNTEELKELQAPLKAKYRETPDTAVITLNAGVTLGAVATAIGVNVKTGSVHAEGDLDFRGTLGVAKDAPVGFKTIRLRFELDTDATEDQVATLLKLTERYCVVAQSLRQPPAFSVSRI